MALIPILSPYGLSLDFAPITFLLKSFIGQ
jgi:hypothetical protein